MTQMTVTMTANDRDLLAAFTKQQAALDKQIRKYDELERKTKEAEKAAKAAAKGTVDGAASAVVSVASITAGWTAAQQAVLAYMASAKKAEQEAEQAALSLDENRKKSQVLMGLRGEAGKKAVTDIEAAAVENAVTNRQAHEAAQQMAGSGFTNEEILQGGGLNSFLKLMNASAARGNNVDAGDLVDAVSRYIASQGEEKTGANIEKYGTAIQRLSGPTNLNLTDMPFLAAEAGTLRGMLTPEEQLSTYAGMLFEQGGAEAATGLRNVALRLSTAKTTKTSSDALKQMNLSPEDVDFVGESFSEVMERLQGGLDRLDEADRRPVLKDLFGEQAIASAINIIKSRKETMARIPQMRDVQAFLADADFMQQGPAAAFQRQESELETLRANRSGMGQSVGREIEIRGLKAGAHPLVTDVQRQAFDVTRFLGAPIWASLIANMRPGVGEDAKARFGGSQTNSQPQKVEIVNPPGGMGGLPAPRQSPTAGLNR